jgi:ABC-type proline/glycine betaine transport system ATPase subunit
MFLDDPLSALDPEVGKRMLEDCIVDLMRGKTRLLVTNQLQFLRYCDKIVALGSGKVVEQGTFTELMSREDGEVKRIVNASSSGQNNTEKDQRKTADNVLGEAAKQGPRKSSIMAPKSAKELLTKEERNIGAVSWSVYNKYLQAGGGFVKFSFVFCAFILSAGNSLASSTWLSVWTSDAKYIRHTQGFYLGIYGMFAGKFERDSILSRLG